MLAWLLAQTPSFAPDAGGLPGASALANLIDAVTDFSDRTQRYSDHWPVVATFELA